MTVAAHRESPGLAAGDPTHTYARTARDVDITTIVVLAVAGAVGLVARWAGVPAAAAVFPGLREIAVGTSLVLLLLAASVGADLAGLRGWALAALAAAALALGAVAAGTFGASAVARSVAASVEIDYSAAAIAASPVTIAALVVAVIALTVRLTGGSRPTRAVAALLAFFVALAGFVLVTGYLVGVPLLYGSKVLPPAFPTSVALVFLGASTQLRTGRDMWPVVDFTGESARARMLRAILPMVLMLVTLEAWASASLSNLEARDAGYALALLAIGAVVVAWILVDRVASRLGGEVDLTEDVLRRDKSKLERMVHERTSELEVTNEHLAGALRSRSLFLASMSHELRTPLNSVIGFTGVLLSGAPGPLNEEQRRQLEMVHGSGTMLLTLVNDLLDVGRMESGEAKVILERFDLSELVAEAAEPLRLAASERSLSLTVTVEPGLVVTSDRIKVRQIVANLLTNAIKFTDEGGVSVSCERSQRPDGPHAVVEVRDSGPGIPAHQLDNVFGAFEQLAGAAKPQGAGLGLAIARSYAGLIGGSLTVESTLGRGSTFTLDIPVAAPPRDPACEPEATAGASEEERSLS